MAERTDLPKIKPQETPGYLNHEAGKWGLIGSLAGGLAAIPAMAMGASKTGRVIQHGAQVAGVVYGAVTGKAEQEREQQEGRVVKTPGYWNKGIASGWFAGSLIAIPVGIVSPTLGVILGLGGATIGAITGSVMRNNSLQRDFNQAIDQRSKETAELQVKIQNLQAGMPSYKNSVTPEESQALDVKQRASGSGDHVAKIQTHQVAPETAALTA